MSRFVLCLVVLVAGAVPLWGQTADVPEKPAGKEARDHFGDLLPAGAVARLGSIRLRHAGEAAVAFSADGQQLFSLGKDNQFQVWSAQDGREVRRLRRTPTLMTNPDGLDEMMLLRLGGGKMLRRHMYMQHGMQPSSEAFSADGKWLAALDSLTEVVLLDTATGQESRRWSLKHSTGHALAFSANGNLLAVGDWSPEEGLIRIWDTSTGKELPHLKVPEGQRLPLRLLFSPDGQYLASVEVNEVRLWHVPSAKRVRVFQGHTNPVMGVAFSASSKLVASAGSDRTIRVWEVDSEEELARITHAEQPFHAVAFAPNGKSLIAAAGNELTLWAWESAAPMRQFPIQEQPAMHVAFSPDGKTMASACATGRLRLWDVATGKPRLASQGFDQPPARVFPESEHLVRALMEDGSALTIDIRSGKVMNRSPRPANPMVIGMSDQANIVVVTNDEGRISLWDVPKNKELFTLEQQPNAGFAGMGFAADGRFVAVSRGTGVDVLTLPAGKTWTTLQKAGPASVLAFSRDNKTLAVATADGSIQLRELSTGRLRLRFLGQQNGPSHLVFSPDARLLAGTCADDVVRLWDTSTGALVRGLAGHFGPVYQLAFSPRDGILATGGEDGHVCLWDLQTGMLKRRFEGHRGGVTTLAFSADGTRLFSGSRDATLLVWDPSSPEPAPAESAKLRDLDMLWNDLGQPDSALAYRALVKLVAQPDKAVPLLRTRLHPVPAAGEASIKKLVTSLDHDNYLVRQQAVRELEKLEGQAGPALRKSLDAKPSPEVVQRVQALLEKIDTPPTDLSMLRALRALEVLERIGTTEARQALQRLADGAPQARLTREAHDCRQRLNRRLKENDQPAPAP